MPKFYVKSGRVREVVDGPCSEQAVFDVLMRHALDDENRLKPMRNATHLGLVTSVSQRGFRSQQTDFYATYHVILGQGEFKKYWATDGDGSDAAQS